MKNKSNKEIPVVYSNVGYFSLATQQKMFNIPVVRNGQDVIENWFKRVNSEYVRKFKEIEKAINQKFGGSNE